jgi:hypothetical protein
MQKTDPILNFRCASSQQDLNVPVIYSIITGLHQPVTNPSNIGILDNFYTNSLITRSREATDATEYSE